MGAGIVARMTDRPGGRRAAACAVVVVVAISLILFIRPSECSATAVCVYDVASQRCRPSACDVEQRDFVRTSVSIVTVAVVSGVVILTVRRQRRSEA